MDLNSHTPKVVFAALARMSDDRSIVKQAFEHWYKQFSGSTLDVFEYVDSIQKFLGLGTAEKKVLMVAMHSAASKLESELAPVPSYISGESNARQATEASSTKSVSKPAVVVLSEHYFSQMCDGVRRSGAGTLTEMLDAMRDEGMPDVHSSVNASLQDIRDGSINLSGSVTENDCKNFCHNVYMFACDFVGPVTADDLSYKTISTLLETSEASRFDPRQLI